jgi:hypothetical protein
LIDRPAAFQGGTPQPDHRDLEPRILIPFDISEATSLTAASKKAGKSVRTLRAWCLEHGLGRRIGSHWHVSRVALAMFLDGDEAALSAYHSGARAGSERVAAYYHRLGLGDLIKRPEFSAV